MCPMLDKIKFERMRGTTVGVKTGGSWVGGPELCV